MYRTKHISVFQRTTTVLMALSSSLLPAMAGTSGSYLSPAGYGKAVDTITYGGASASSSSAAMYNPSAGVSGTSSPLPATTPKGIYCQSKGYPNIGWSIQAYVTGGATADNPAITSQVNVPTPPCASYTVDTTNAVVNANSGIVTVNATATTGAAIWLRGVEYLGSGAPSDLDQLLGNSDTKFDLLFVGPLNFDHDQCTALVLPYTTTTARTNFYFIVDAVAQSAPFTIVCPPNVVFSCSDTPSYPPAQTTGGCGNVTVSYNPPANLLPTGTTTVTATATDESGNTAQCNFTATRSALGFAGFDSPIGSPGGSCGVPARTINGGSVIPIKFTTTCNGSPYSQGTPTLSIQKCPSLTPVAGGNFQASGNQWHFNWDTSGLGKNGIYQLTVTLQDGSTRTVVVKLK